MKTKILAIALLTLFGVNEAMAQEQGDMRIGLGINYGTKAGFDDNGEDKGKLGFTPSFEYLVTDVIGLSASYDFFFKSEIASGSDIITGNISAINIDGHYYFLTGDTQVYGLVGVGFGKAKVEFDIGGFSGEETDSEVGLNIGAGALFPLSDQLGINAQIKYATQYDGQIVINVGLRFML